MILDCCKMGLYLLHQWYMMPMRCLQYIILIESAETFLEIIKLNFRSCLDLCVIVNPEILRPVGNQTISALIPTRTLFIFVFHETKTSTAQINQQLRNTSRCTIFPECMDDEKIARNACLIPVFKGHRFLFLYINIFPLRVLWGIVLIRHLFRSSYRLNQRKITELKYLRNIQFDHFYCSRGSSKSAELSLCSLKQFNPIRTLFMLHNRTHFEFLSRELCWTAEYQALKWTRNSRQRIQPPEIL